MEHAKEFLAGVPVPWLEPCPGGTWTNCTNCNGGKLSTFKECSHKSEKPHYYCPEHPNETKQIHE